MSTMAGKRKAESTSEDLDHDSKRGLEESSDPMNALATAAVQAKKTETDSADEARPAKKAKASSHKTEASASASAKDAIHNALSRLSKPGTASSLTDYEKCSIFPQKLMQLLKNEEAPDAIWWLEDGESFAIEQEQFTKVMNKVSRTSKKKVKLDSILRNLYRWGFKKLKDRDLPSNVLAYSHPKFKRDACVELQTFSKKAEQQQQQLSPSGSSSLAPPATALARALSARAQAGYGDNWNDEGAADKSTLLMHAQMHAQMHPSQFSLLGQHNLHMMPDPRMAFMLQHQQQQQHHHHHHHNQRQILLQQELMFQDQQQRHQLLYEAAAAEQYAAQRLAGGPAPAGFPHHFAPSNPYKF